MPFFQVLLFLGIVFLLGLSSTGLCNATYMDFDDNRRFQVGQQMRSETPKSERGVIHNLKTLIPFKHDAFFLGTIGLHTSFEGTAFGGLTAYLGGRKTSKGFGILGSYGAGVGYDTRIQIMNISASFSYKIGKSTILLSGGFSHVHFYDNMYVIDEEESGSIVSITYLYRPGNRFTLIAQGRLQSRGIMLSTGVGF